MLFQQVVSRLQKSIALSAIPLAVIAVVPQAAQAVNLSLQDIDRIYVFGDSLSDTGNEFNATRNAPGGPFPPPPYSNGRFSNGPVWVEYLADRLGVPQTNFAFGGATTGDVNVENNRFPGLTPALPGLQGEISNFRTANPSADPNALYIVWAGANDYLGARVGNPTGPVTNLSTAVTSLANVGARNFLVVNLPNLGEVPATSTTAVSDPLNSLTAAHNSGLAASLNNLSQTLGPNVNIIPFDVNAVVNEAITNPAQFGFTNVTDACLTSVGVCSNPNQYVFWDDLHPTTVAHRIVADEAFSTLQAQAIPEPSSAVGLLAFGAIGAASMLKRKSKKVSFVKASKG